MRLLIAIPLSSFWRQRSELKSVSFDRWARPASVIFWHQLRSSELKSVSFDRWARPASVILSHAFR